MDVTRRFLRRVRREGFLPASWTALACVLDQLPVIGHLRAILASRKLKPKLAKATATEDLLRLAYSFGFLGVRFVPMQLVDELKALLALVASHRSCPPRTIVEIGTANGGTLFVLTRVADPEGIIVSIDLPGGPFGGGYPRWRRFLYRSFALPRQTLVLLRTDSHERETLQQTQCILSGNTIDLLLIDGDHTYEGVKRDFEMYSPLVGKGGLIVLHDICSGPPEKVGGVPAFWSEIKTTYPHLEIVKDRNQVSYGIGVLRCDDRA